MPKASKTSQGGKQPAETEPAATKSTPAGTSSAKPAAKKAPTPKKATPPAKAAADKPGRERAGAPKQPARARGAETGVPDKTSTAKAVTARKTPARKGAPAAKGSDARFLEEQRALLLEERQQYERQAAALKAEADQLAAEMEPGDIQFDEESGEGDTINVERERDLALSAQARAAVDEIDRALAKIDLGTYGLCERCGQPIPRPRLKALPYAALCVACKSGGLSRR